MNIQQQEKEKLTLENAKAFTMNELLAFHQARYVVKRSGVSAEEKAAQEEQEKQLLALFPPVKVKKLSNPERNQERSRYRSIRKEFGKRAAIIFLRGNKH